MSRVVALIDGEHYPPVVRFALTALGDEHEVAAAVFVGGTEKVDAEDAEAYGVPVVRASDRGRRDRARRSSATRPTRSSTSPTSRSSRRPTACASARSCSPSASSTAAPTSCSRRRRARVTPCTPTLGVIGTGKRVGKTAISAYVARELKAAGTDLVVLAMGRGGPSEPELIHGEEVALTTPDLLALAREGKHASSDNYEDAVMSRVTTVGCRRCGGGLAGETFFSNVPEGARVADQLGKQLMVLEGCGAAIPPVHADAAVLVVGAGRGTGYVTDFFGPYRFARADLAVISFAEEPIATADDIAAMRAAIAGLRPDLTVVATTFRPQPIEPIAGRRVLFATTAPADIAPRLAAHLETEYGCEVVATTSSLSNRALLREDLRAMRGAFDTIVTELKAAAIDVVAAEGEAAGVPTVLCDNVPVAVDGADLAALVDRRRADWRSSAAPTRRGGRR